MRLFVSSTSEDLKDYRAAVIAAIRKLDEGRGLYLVCCMEDYSPQDSLPVEKCRQDVAACDVYVGLFAWRYGHVPDGHTQSITEQEFREAIDRGLVVRCFLIQDEDVPWPPRCIDRGEKATRLESLRNELLGKQACGFFVNDPAKLALDVVTALSTLR